MVLPNLGFRVLLAAGSLLLGWGPPVQSAYDVPTSLPTVMVHTAKPLSAPVSVSILHSPKPRGELIRIRPGDTLWALSQRFHLEVKQLERVNHLTGTTIIAGHSLMIPQKYTVQRGDSLKGLAFRFGVLPDDLRAINPGLGSGALPVGTSLLIPYTGPRSLPAEQPRRMVAVTVPQGTVHSPIASNFSLLAHLVEAEAGNQPFIGQVAVAAVVINRIKSHKFPNTLEGVIFAPGQFESVSNGTYRAAPSPTAIRAAGAALAGWDPTHGATYFFNPALSHDAWMSHQKVLVQIADQRFCR